MTKTVGRLPLWAQQHIKDLERRVVEKTSECETLRACFLPGGNKGTKVFIREILRDDTPLPPRTMIRFTNKFVYYENHADAVECLFCGASVRLPAEKIQIVHSDDCAAEEFLKLL